MKNYEQEYLENKMEGGGKLVEKIILNLKFFKIKIFKPKLPTPFF